MYGVYLYYYKLKKLRAWLNDFKKPKDDSTLLMKCKTIAEAKWQVTDEQSDIRKEWSGSGWRFYYKKLY